MRSAPTTFALLLACAACSTAGAVPTDLAAMLRDAPAEAPLRLWLAGNRIVAAAVPGGPGLLPAEARVALDAVAPRGELLFQGREWSERGTGFRVDKRYRGAGEDHDRSVLLSADGRVLERDHTVPIGAVPQHVLAAALTVAGTIDEARIVSGPEREECWRLVVHDRSGREFVVTVALDGRLLGSLRRLGASVAG
ncbi:MAG: hypothetical protein JNL08_19820 [Planctomycetes bacterium]|nr:hypothetical protein [Planctomycetota bacterium]